jgi:hypothetical protein
VSIAADTELLHWALKQRSEGPSMIEIRVDH